MASTYLRLDRRTPAPDVFGKPGVSYPHGSLSYPRIVEEFSARATHPVPDFGSAHPNATAYPNAVLWQINPAKGDNTDRKYNLVYDTLPGPVFTSEYYDAETNSIITETRQEVPVGAADPPVTSLSYLTDFQSVPVDLVKKIFVTRTYPSTITSQTIITYERENYVYPAIMANLVENTNYGILTAANGYTSLFLSPTIEAERPREISKQIKRTFQTSAPDAATIMGGIYVIQPVRHQFSSPVYSFQTGPVICNAVSLTYNSGTSNPVWPSLTTMSYSHAASTPSADTYTADRTASLSSGTLKTIYRESKKLAVSLYMLTEVAIPIL